MFYKQNRALAGVEYARSAIFFIAIGICLALMTGCSGTAKPKLAELGPNAALLGTKLAWTARVGASSSLATEVVVVGSTAIVTGGDGSVAAIDARTGADVWRGSVGASPATGAGSDGTYAAVVTRGNEVVTLNKGQLAWRAQLGAQVFTTPLVAGGRVFVASADRAVIAFDAATGKRLWTQQRPGEPLVLRQAGVMLAVGDTLVVGQGGRLLGLSPNGGSVRWDAPIASPRGVNDIERLVDLIGPVSRVQDNVCARAFQASIGCVDAARGSLLWSKPANGATGLHGDERTVFGTESDSKVMAWRRSDGERIWVTERLLFRGVTAPLSAGRSVVVGDSAGFVHWLSQNNGSLLTRMATDGSAIISAPVLVGNTIVVVSKNGGVFGFVPE
jgi:outer membrane protein assembly factor BamB